ncbi:ABC transporter ATP-binding protein [Dactylosporangium sp. NPDC051484]|uniref:ABC transporter ATP-binding protein n=1 Tax=Dactylosporangium sp. NPDC051484 TaxID=3154942 RepID=UPI00344CCD4B
MRELVLAIGTVGGIALRRSPVRMITAVVLMVLQAVAMPLAAPWLGALVDAAIDRDPAAATRAGTAIAVALIGAVTFGHFAHIVYFELIELLIADLDERLMRVAGDSDTMAHHDRPEYADHLAAVRQQLHRIAWSLQALLSGTGILTAMVITAIILARVSPWLLLLPLLAIPPLLTGRRAEALVDAARTTSAERSRLALHIYGLMTKASTSKEVRLCRLTPRLLDEHGKLWRETTATLWRAEIRAAALRIAGLLSFAVGYLGAVLLVVDHTVRGNGSVGTVVLTVSLAAQVHFQVSHGIGLLQEMDGAASVVRRLRWLESAAAQSAPPPGHAVPERITTGIRLRGVGFSYPEAEGPVLADVDCVLPAGSTVALVGENGAGKSTLVKLLCRFYDPAAGAIEVDGVDIAGFAVPEWRSRIAAGFQDFARFQLPVRQTVGVGDVPRVDDEAAAAAALERAGGTDVVEGLPDGWSTQLGKAYADGAELSGGQWQKLALGRAMMRTDPLLLILDEPSAALDAETEHRLFEQYAAGARQASQRTGTVTLLVTHRFSTVRIADLIIVVGDGGILEFGSHATLMQRGGTYAELYSIQAAAYR